MIEFFPTRTIFLVVGDSVIYWYGLLYVMAVVVGWRLLPRMLQLRQIRLTRDQQQILLLALGLGVLLGSRLGYVVWYEPGYFWQHPREIIAWWQGGMSAHGGVVGVLAALVWFSRRYRVSLLAVADGVVVVAALGLAIGRLGNFINQEIYGTPTNLPWGVNISGVLGPRHPIPLYAMLKNGLIAVVCYMSLRRGQPPHGKVAALFLIMYGSLRFCLDYLRVGDQPPIMLLGLSLSRGQILSLPLIMAGVIVWWRVHSKGSLQPAAGQHTT